MQGKKTTTRDKKLFLEALQRRKGIVTLACKEVNISSMTFYRWQKDDPDFYQKSEEIRYIEIGIIAEDRLAERSAALGARFLARLQAIDNPLIREVRGRGLMIGMELDTRRAPARVAAEWMLARGLMTKDTHEKVLRFAPPLIVSEAELEWAATTIEDALADLARRFPAGDTP